MMHIACCSFGKDSIATILLAKEHKEPLDEVIFSEVMFNETISGEIPEHVEWIYNVAKPRIESFGFPVKILRSKDTYTTLFERLLSRSKREERNGKMWGFPLSLSCYVNNYLKIKPIKEYMKDKEVIQYVGIAIDEKRRLDAMHKRSPKHISLLEKYGYTEQMAKDLCVKYDLLSPIYNSGTRGGCWFCPNASEKVQKHLYQHHNDIFSAWENLYFKNKENLLRTKFSWKKEFETLLKDIKEG